MTNIETTTANKTAAVPAQTAHVAPEKASSKKAATKKNGAPTGGKAANGAKTGKPKATKAQAAAPKKAAKTGRKAAKPAGAKPTAKKAAAKVSASRAESKGAKILALIQRPKGATLAEIMKAADRQAHSVRGFISPAAKKHGIKIESTKNEAGERIYKTGK